MVKQNMYLRVVPELKSRLQELAKKTGQSVNALIVQACWRMIAEGIEDTLPPQPTPKKMMPDSRLWALPEKGEE